MNKKLQAKPDSKDFSYEDWASYTLLSVSCCMGLALIIFLLWHFIHWAAAPDLSSWNSWNILDEISRTHFLDGQTCTFQPGYYSCSPTLVH